MKLVWAKLSHYRKTAFPEGGAPDPRTIMRQIDRGEIVGERRGIGKRAPYWVLMDADTGLEVRPHQLIGRKNMDSAGVRPVNNAAAKILEKAYQ